MKPFVFSLAIGLVCAVAATAQEKLPQPESTVDKISYSLGYGQGRSLKQNQIDLNLKYFLEGMRDGLGGVGPLITEQEMKTTLRAFQQAQRTKQQERLRSLAAKNKKEGEAFLAKNKTRPGVITLPSGLQYEVLKEGDGPKPKAGDKVTVHYVGTLLDGTQFDSSIDRGKPSTFTVRGVIPGWIEALQLMPVGSKWKLYIPSDMAYGERGSPPRIGPNATLVFEVELLSIGEPQKVQ